VAAPKKTFAARAVNARPVLVIIGLSVIAVIAIGGLAYLQAARRQPTPGSVAQAAAHGTASFESQPSGASVVVDGEPRGNTPLRLSLAPGRHVAEIDAANSHRSIPFEILPGAVVSQYVEFANDATPATGRLEITSDPSGAPVSVDGVPHGSTPLSLTAIAPGSHAVSVGQGEAAVRRTVTVAAGAVASVMVSTGPTGPAAGWAVFKAPFEMSVLEDNQLIGSTSTSRLMMSAGKHELTLTNAALNFKTNLSLQISAAKTSTTAVAVPNGSLSVNALPWAEVSIDGSPAGTTPLGNLAIPVGSHEVVWRHPQLGERRQTVMVKAQLPTRAAVDFGKQP
jgi:serine/threonine-protein kinase